MEMPVHKLFINYIANHYSEIETKLKIICGRNKQPYDQDALQESIVRCYTAIEKKGFMKDTSPYGIESYVIRTFFNYIREIKRSCQNAKRDYNITSDNINDIYENWYNNTNDTAKVKIANDLYKDYATLYIMMTVEENFDQEHFYLFKLKHLCNMTYKQVCEKSGVKGCRQKILEVKKWLKDNITKEDLNKAFNNQFGEII